MGPEWSLLGGVLYPLPSLPAGSGGVLGPPGGEGPLSSETLIFEKDPRKIQVGSHFNTQKRANGSRGVQIYVNLTSKKRQDAQDGLKRLQDNPKTAPRGPKTAPRGPKMAPRWPQDGPKTAPSQDRFALVPFSLRGPPSRADLNRPTKGGGTTTGDGPDVKGMTESTFST